MLNVARRVGLACLAALSTLGMSGLARPEVPRAETIFARAKDAWRSRQETPFVTFGLRERYTWRGRVHDNWWQVAYRNRDRELALRRTIVEADEERRLKGSPILLHIKIHHGQAHADTFDTNPNADAFPILDPLIEPNASFGLVRREPKASLVGERPLRADPSGTATDPTSTATGAAGSSPNAGNQAAGGNGANPGTADGARAADAAVTAPAAPVPVNRPAPAASPTEKPLRELVRVEAVARDYAIALAGTERLRGNDTYHLTLTPLHEPHVYRLRDMWVNTATYATLQLAVQGLFEGKPYDDARWLVTYVSIDGRNYVQQIRTEEELRFGMDRVVSGLQFDFVQYAFPATMQDMVFAHIL